MRALIVTGKLVTDQEFFYAKQRLVGAGWKVDVAVRGKETVLGYHGTKIVPDIDVSEINVNNYELLILPGGAKAMEYIRQDRDVLAIIAAFHLTGRVIGSACHAAQLLISAGLVCGRRISGYYSIKDDIKNAGGEYVEVIPFKTEAQYVVCDRIVSTSHYDCSGPWMESVLAEVARNSAAHE